MKKLWLVLGGVLVLAIGGVSVYVSTIDWNQHKDKIAEQFSEITGKKVVFEGPVSFNILPSPKLTATNIKIFSKMPKADKKPLATIKKLEANLSLSALLNGNFEVEMMSLFEPEIWFALEDGGTFNWQTPLTQEQRQRLEDIDIALDSVLIEKAKVNLIDENHGINTHLDNLNGEVIAESVFGPYRIEGSYVKDKNPEGFAISLGQFSESFATSVNFVLNQPASQSYLRFDGTVLTKNGAVNGNLIIESQKFKEFFDSTLPNQILDKDFDYPLVLSLELDTNRSRISMSNIVVKYGQSAGAGNILIPLLEDEFVIDEKASSERREIEVAFNMTDLDLTPWVALLKKFINQQSQKDVVYLPLFNFDVLADLKAIKTNYNGQNIKDFVFSADFVDNNFNIRELSGILPGETNFKLTGDVFSLEEKLTYNFNTDIMANDLQKLASWLGVDLKPVAPSTLKKALVKTGISGNLRNIKISPLDLTLDKTLLSGELGIVNDERPQVYVALNSDSINFDNYIAGLPEEYRDKSTKEKMAYRFSKLGWLKDIDVDFRGGLDLGIYESVPFENTMLNFKLTDGVMDIRQLTIGSLGNAKLAFEGNLSGFGGTPQVTNLKYDVSTKNFTSFLNKFDFPQPHVNLKDLQDFSSQGIVTGSFDRAAMKTVSKLGNWNITYSGQVSQNEKGYLLDGDVIFKTPDFVKFVNTLNFNYQPKSYTLGLLSLNAKLAKNGGIFKLSDMDAYIGASNIKGMLWMDNSQDKSNIITDLKISRFEPSRFIYNPSEKNNQSVQGATLQTDRDKKAEFLLKPVWDKTKFNYDFYKKFNLSGKFIIDDLVYEKYVFKNAQFNLNIKDEQIKLDGFKAALNEGDVSGNAVLSLMQNPELKLDFVLNNQNVNGKFWSGEKYGLKSGRFSADGRFNLPAIFINDMILGAVGDVNVNVQRPIIKGWNFIPLVENLKTRDRSEGLVNFATENLQSGDTVFDELRTNLKFNQGRVVTENASLVSETVKIDVMNESNLDTWDMLADFQVNLSQLSQVPPFAFTLSGKMSNPALKVDVSSITSNYDAKWAKIEADKKAAEQARVDALRSMMDLQQKRAREIKDSLDVNVVNVFDKLSAKAVSPQAKNQYQTLKDEIGKTSSGLDEIFTLGLTQEFDESLPKALEGRNDVYASELPKLQQQLQKIYVDDLKFQINDIYSHVRDSYNRSKNAANVYRDKFADFPKRLAKIKTEYNLDEDKLVNQLKQDIENNLLLIDNLNSEVGKKYLDNQKLKETAKLEEFLGYLSEAKENVDKELQNLGDNINKLLDYVAQSISLEEKSYQARVKAAEQAKKVQENIGKISAATGKNKMIIRDIEDIEKSEKVLNEQPIRVLDFSKDKSSSNMEINRLKNNDDENVQQESDSGVLKPIEGDVINASGTVIRKQ